MTGSILIVDDDAKVLEILERSLSKKGHEVHLATDGAGALKSYKLNEPDVVVLDMMLPDMDGREVLKKMRETPGDCEPPVLFLSANGDPAMKVSSFNGGAADYLVKPISLNEFNAKVEKVLETHLRTRTLEEEKVALESEISERQENAAQINRELKRQLLSMKTLITVSQDLNRRLDLDELINGFALTIVGELKISSMAFFILRHSADDHFVLHGVKGFDKSRISNLKLESKSPFTKWLTKQQAPQKIVRSGDKRWAKKLPDVRLALFEYVTPIVVKQKLKGIVFTGPKITGDEYTIYDLDMLMSVCNSLGIGMDNARLFQELQATYLSTVKALVSIIEAKDAYTRGHTERVADYAVALGAKMQLSKEELRDIAFGAVLHDIGKLVVYEKVLNKPGDLNEDEWKALRQHPEVGASIIENMEFLAGTVPLVRHHHEAWDGTGYPAGLQGEEIPIGARIIAVTDSYDAMTTDRSYRKKLSSKTAIRKLREQAGSQFDPDVVTSFVELIQKDGFRPRRGRQPDPDKS